MTEQEKVPLLKQKTHPAVVSISAVGLVFLLLWWANVNGLLSFISKWQKDRDNVTVHRMAERVGGDYSKLTDSERKWLDEITNHHGALAIARYGRRQPSNGGMPMAGMRPPNVH